MIARVPWFYGPHQPPHQTLFYRMVRDGKVPVVGRGDNLNCTGLLLAALGRAHPTSHRLTHP